jgi:hypothetical protein
MNLGRARGTIEAGCEGIGMMELIAGTEGFRMGRRVQAGMDETSWADGQVRSIQDVWNLTRTRRVCENRRS